MNVRHTIRHTLPAFTLKKAAAVSVVAALALASCTEKDDTWDPYYNWAGRNAVWFAAAADTAMTEIAKAKADYGDDWENHCPWRIYKSTMRSPQSVGVLTDNVVCKVLQPGTGTFNATFSDSVRIHFRGWLMSTEYLTENNIKEAKMSVFTQTYAGDFDPAVAAPQDMAVGGTVEGFQTALEHMVDGDDWLVYIPSQLAYGSESSSVIPAYSTLLYRIQMVRAFKSGEGAREWK